MKYIAPALLALLCGTAIASENYSASWWWYNNNGLHCTPLPGIIPSVTTPWAFAEATKRVGIEYREEVVTPMLLVYRQTTGAGFYVAALTEANCKAALQQGVGL